MRRGDVGREVGCDQPVGVAPDHERGRGDRRIVAQPPRPRTNCDRASARIERSMRGLGPRQVASARAPRRPPRPAAPPGSATASAKHSLIVPCARPRGDTLVNRRSAHSPEHRHDQQRHARVVAQRVDAQPVVRHRRRDQGQGADEVGTPRRDQDADRAAHRVADQVHRPAAGLLEVADHRSACALERVVVVAAPGRSGRGRAGRSPRWRAGRAAAPAKSVQLCAEPPRPCTNSAGSASGRRPAWCGRAIRGPADRRPRRPGHGRRCRRATRARRRRQAGRRVR